MRVADATELERNGWYGNMRADEATTAASRSREHSARMRTGMSGVVRRYDPESRRQFRADGAAQRRPRPQARVSAHSAPARRTPRYARSCRPRLLPLWARLVALALAVIVVAAVVAHTLTSPSWRVSSIAVEGTSDPRVVAAIEALPLTGPNIFRADVPKDTWLIAALPVVASTSVHREYPHTLRVSVTVRQPALLWLTPRARLVVAADGTILGTVTDAPITVSPSLPTVRDTSSSAAATQRLRAGKKLDPETVEMATQLLGSLPHEFGTRIGLQYDGARGFLATAPTGTVIVFGTPADAASVAAPSFGAGLMAQSVRAGVGRQLAELSALLAQLSREGQSAAVIDLRWASHPDYRPGA